MCKAVMEALVGEGYAMTDYEALVFLPAVVEKSGHNQVGPRAALSPQTLQGGPLSPQGGAQGAAAFVR